MINFTKDLETGIPKIDMQHKELINRLNGLVTAGMASITKEETEKMLSFVEDYIKEHFSDEESLQWQSGYPQYEAHKSMHSKFTQDFMQLHREYTLNGPSAAFTLQLNKAIIDWIVKHIRYTDSEFAKYYLGGSR